MSEIISTYEGMEHIEVPCLNCGDPVRTLIVLGARHPQKLCDLCKVQVRRVTTGELEEVTRYAFKYWGQNSEVRVFRPGDPGFDERVNEMRKG